MPQLVKKIAPKAKITYTIKVKKNDNMYYDNCDEKKVYLCIGKHLEANNLYKIKK